jgi:hypothetical protein
MNTKTRAVLEMTATTLSKGAQGIVEMAAQERARADALETALSGLRGIAPQTPAAISGAMEDVDRALQRMVEECRISAIEVEKLAGTFGEIVELAKQAVKELGRPVLLRR